MHNMSTRRLPRLLRLLPFLLMASHSFGAVTRYISPAGSDAGSGISEALPLKSFSKAFSLMSPGDELVLLDGNYSNDAKTGYMSWDDGTCSACGQPPSGVSLAKMTVVRAKNPGAVFVDGGAREALFLGRSFRKDSYIKIQGITFRGGGGLYNTSFDTIKECGFYKATQSGGGVFGIGTNDGNWGNSRNLIEDCWVWGKERLLAANYRADRNVWRRVLLRGDGCNTAACTGSGNPNVGFTVYNSSFVSVQNVMVVDRILGGGESYGDFASAQHNSGGIDMGPGEYLGPNEWLGSIALNSPDEGFHFEADDTHPNTFKLSNLVAWKTRDGGINIGARAQNTDVSNVTIGFANNPGADGLRLDPGVVGGGTVKNIIVTTTGRYGINSPVQPSYSDVYNTISDNFNQSPCSAGCHNTNPLSDGTPPSLKYIARIEGGSKMGNAGIGANVVKRYGVDGARFGDTNYNMLGAVNLWPWPNEGRIKADMCASETRGFCSAESLTEYVWTFLGAKNPYAGVGAQDTTAPSVVSVTPRSTTQVVVMFSKPLEKVSAETKSNYSVDQGVSIVSALLEKDNRSVTLTLTPYRYNIVYKLTVNNVKDRAVPPNEIGDNAEKTFSLDPPDRLKPVQKNIAPNMPNGGKIVFGPDAVEVTVVNAAGHEVYNGKKDGSNVLIWKGVDDHGAVVEPGYYMCRIKGIVGNTVYSMVLVEK